MFLELASQTTPLLVLFVADVPLTTRNDRWRLLFLRDGVRLQSWQNDTCRDAKS
jgi:hypothetical protein